MIDLSAAARTRDNGPPMELEIRKIKEVLAPFSPAVAYLFGSQARERSRPDSDVDIAFVPGRQCDPFDVFEAAQRLAAAIGRSVDLVDLSRASAVMKAEVLRTGRRLFVHDERGTQEFEMYALSDYARTNEERRIVLERFEAKHRAK